MNDIHIAPWSKPGCKVINTFFKQGSSGTAKYISKQIVFIDKKKVIQDVTAFVVWEGNPRYLELLNEYFVFN